MEKFPNLNTKPSFSVPQFSGHMRAVIKLPKKRKKQKGNEHEIVTQSVAAFDTKAISKPPFVAAIHKI